MPFAPWIGGVEVFFDLRALAIFQKLLSWAFSEANLSFQDWLLCSFMDSFMLRANLCMSLLALRS